jgi:hypothetical protein
MSGVSFHSLDEKVHGEGNLPDAGCVETDFVRLSGAKKTSTASVISAGRYRQCSKGFSPSHPPPFLRRSPGTAGASRLAVPQFSDTLPVLRLH